MKSIPILFNIKFFRKPIPILFFDTNFFETNTDTFSKLIPIPSKKLEKFRNREVSKPKCHTLPQGEEGGKIVLKKWNGPILKNNFYKPFWQTVGNHVKNANNGIKLMHWVQFFAIFKSLLPLLAIWTLLHILTFLTKFHFLQRWL